MKSANILPVTILLFALYVPSVKASVPEAGFFLPDSVDEMTLRFKIVKDLIVLPVTLNDSIQVNLVLDTGCRNLVLFGKRFKKRFHVTNGSPVIFSGLGSGPPVEGVLSIGNKVSIGKVLGTEIPVVVVTDNRIFRGHEVDGVIGYEIFIKFEIELNVSERTITFRQAMKSDPPLGFSTVPLRVTDARPVMESEVVLGKRLRKLELMIDTGSSLGLLLKTTDLPDIHRNGSEQLLGIGFNGPVSGYQVVAKKLVLVGLEMKNVATAIVLSPWHNNASLGMDVLKDYIVIVNYCKSYACFKRNDA